MTIFSSVAIALVVFGLMFWSIVRHRKTRGQCRRSSIGSLKVEIPGTAIPVLILVAMAVPATRTLIAMEDTSASELTVLVTGLQWKWHWQVPRLPDRVLPVFAYAARADRQRGGQDAGLPEWRWTKPLVLPSGKKVRFLLTADDVIHSWWVPDFAIKKDAVPGFINETWARIDKPGLYYGQVRRTVRARPRLHAGGGRGEDARGLRGLGGQQVAAAEQAKAEAESAGPMSMDEQMALGWQVYDGACVARHQAGGEGPPGVFLALKGSAIATGEPATPHPHRAVRQDRHRDAGLRQAARRQGARRGHHVRAQRLGATPKGDQVQPGRHRGRDREGE